MFTHESSSYIIPESEGFYQNDPFLPGPHRPYIHWYIHLFIYWPPDLLCSFKIWLIYFIFCHFSSKPHGTYSYMKILVTYSFQN